MANMKATIIEEKWDNAGNFVGSVLVENNQETWSSGGCRVFFEAPKGGHTKSSMIAAMAQYAADHEKHCMSDLTKVVSLEDIGMSNSVSDDGGEIEVSPEAARMRAERVKVEQS